MFGLTTDSLLYKILNAGVKAGSAGARLGGRGLGQLGIGASRHLGNILINGTFNPISREMDYQSNKRIPNTIPPLDELINLAYSKAITPQEFAQFSAVWGAQCGAAASAIDVNLPGAAQGLGIPERVTISEERWRLWQAMLVNNRPHYDHGLLRKWARQGVPGTADALRAALKQEGFPDQAPQDWYVNEAEPLDSGVIFSLLLLQQITPVEATRLLGIIGYDQATAAQMIGSLEEKPGFSESIRLLLTGHYTERDVKENLYAAGVRDQVTVDKLLTMRFSMPGAGELLQAAGRHSWADDLAAVWNLDGEAPPEYSDWAAKLGLFFNADTGPVGDRKPGGHDWAQLLWRQHWQLPSFGALQEIIYRCRGRATRFVTGPESSMIPPDGDVINATLGAQGIPGPMRQYMAALVYRPVPVRMLGWLIQAGTVKPEYVVGVLLDQGFRPDVAELLGKALWDRSTKGGTDPSLALARRAWSRRINAIEKAYTVGSLTGPQAETALVANQVPVAVATSILTTIDIEVATGIVEAVIKRTRSDWFAGRTSLEEARARLIKASVAVARIGQLLASWQAERGQGHVVAGTAKVQSWLRKGYITRAEAIRRLNNLGWSAADELLLLAEVQAGVDQDQAKVLREDKLDGNRKSREIEKAIGQAREGVNRLVGRLKELTPPAKLIKLYWQGKLQESYVRRRLALMGIDDEAATIQILAGEPKAKTPKVAKPAAAASQNAPSGGGNMTPATKPTI